MAGMGDDLDEKARSLTISNDEADNMTSTAATGAADDKQSTAATNNSALTQESSKTSTPKAIIKNVDMTEEMQQVAVDLASEAMEKFTVEKDIAAHVKKTMDQKYGPTWHAVVGKNYGSYVTHETQHFIYFYLGQIAFLLWRA